MILSAVVAVAEDGVIGHQGGLPWHLPADLRHFKAKTLGKPVLMGRRTFESIGRPLPQRRNIVVTRGVLAVPGIEVAASIEDALALCAGEPEVAVIGGAQLYRALLPRLAVIHLTRVHARIPGDTFFPQLAADEWRERDRQEFAADEHNAHAMSFITLERVRAPG